MLKLYRVANRSTPVAWHVQRRGQHSWVSRTKGDPNMRHLDIYARRDPQLAPYLLREVDIEHKRKCRKVTFAFWLTVFIATLLYNQRSHCDVAYYMRQYVECTTTERLAKDEDVDRRRAMFVALTGCVKDAFERDQRWTAADLKAVEKVLSQ